MSQKVGTWKEDESKQVEVEDVKLEDHEDVVVQVLLEGSAGETRR